MPAVRTDKMTVKEEKDKEKKEKTTRQSFSCAECRRLKLKCSRTWPCTSCEKRGCAQVCPTGTIKTGKGKRQILANTEDLHDRIAELELALAKAHAHQSTQPHPLLQSAYVFSPRDAVRLLPKEARDELVAAERAKEKEGRDLDCDDSDTPRLLEDEDDADMLGEDDDVVDSAFGTLTLGRGGHARYMGSFAGSEYLRDGRGEGDDGSNGPQRPPGAGLLLTPPHSNEGLPMSSLPLMMAGIQVRPGVDVEHMRRMLPDWDTEGQHLVKNYWLNVNWMYMPIPRPLFETDFLLHVYKLDEPVDAHKLACVFLVMALGVMFDLTGPPFRPRREELFALGQACLGAVGLERASLATVRALHLCGTYILNDNHGSGGEIFWPIVGMLIKVATGLGLHRDGSAFGLSEEETEDRRLLWWECVLYDRLRAMCFARPVTMLNKYTDTKTPADLGLQNDPCQFHATKLKLAMLMEKVIDVQTRVAPVPYSLVAQIDAEFKQFREDMPEPLAPGVQINRLPFDPSVPPHQVIHRLGIRLLIAQSRLLLSRPFFRKALEENPSDPEFCKHGSSFVALYESATEIIFIVKQLVMYHPSLVARWWFYWFHAYSSAVCLAATTILAPMSPYATPAFEGLCTMYDIAKAAQEGCRAKKGLSALFRLKCRAEDVLRKNNRMGDISSSRRPPANAQFRPHLSIVEGDSDAEGEEDELSHLDGSGKLRRMPESNTRKSPPTALGLARQAQNGQTAGGADASARNASQSGQQGHVQIPGRPPTPPMTSTNTHFAHRASTSVDLTSPLSDRSVATSTTLNEPWEGIVPPPPPMIMDDAQYTHHRHQQQQSANQHPQSRRPGMSHHFSSHSMSSVPMSGHEAGGNCPDTASSNGMPGANGNPNGNNMMYPPPTPITSVHGNIQMQQSFTTPSHATQSGASVHSGSYEQQISPALSTATWNSNSYMMPISSGAVNGASHAGAGGGSMNRDTFDMHAAHSHVSGPHTGFTPQQLNFHSLSQVQSQGQSHSGHSISGQSLHSQTTMISPAFSSHSQSLPSTTPLWLPSNTLASTSFSSSASGMGGSGMMMYAQPGPGGYTGQISDNASGQGGAAGAGNGNGQGQGQMISGNMGNMANGTGSGWDFGMDADLSMALGLELEGDDALGGTLGMGMGYVDNDGLGTFNWNDLFGGQGI